MNADCGFGFVFQGSIHYWVLCFQALCAAPVLSEKHHLFVYTNIQQHSKYKSFYPRVHNFENFPPIIIKYRFHSMEMYGTVSDSVNQDQSVLKSYEIILI